jgi:hypothetical protein
MNRAVSGRGSLCQRHLYGFYAGTKRVSMLETPGQDYSKISRKVSSGMRRRSFQLLGLIIALIIQLQLITACGNANQAAPPSRYAECCADGSAGARQHCSTCGDARGRHAPRVDCVKPGKS